MKANRWTIARRLVQLAVAALLASPALGLTFFQGNLGSASLAGLKLSDPLAVLQLLLLTGAAALPAILGVASVLVLYFVTGGRSFCGWVCPVHLLTDLADLLPGRGRLPRWRLGWKWSALGVTALLSLALGLPAFETLSPIGIAGRALSFGPAPELALLALLVLAELLLVRRLWCRSLCPLGAVYVLLGRFSPLRVRFYAERCTGCGDCRQVCFVPEVLDPCLEQGDPSVLSGDCTRCGACIGICAESALAIGYRNPHSHGGVK